MDISHELTNNRLDVSVYNEATGFVVTSDDLAGNEPEFRDFSNSNNWNQGLMEGVFVPVELYQDDTFIARIVLDELSPEEQKQSLAEFTWKLQVPSGILVIAAGSEYVLGESGEDFEDYYRKIPVPPGDYLVTIHTLITSVNAEACLEFHGDADSLPLGQWWRDTRPDEDMPMWLQYGLAEGYYTDAPEHDEAWSDWDSDYDPETDPLIDFIIQLRPLTGEPSLPVLDNMEAGWFLFDKRHELQMCPTGLPAVNVWDPVEESIAAFEALPLKGVDVLERVAEKQTASLNVPVSLPAGKIQHAFRLALYANDSVDAEIILTYPEAIDVNTWQAFDFIDLQQIGQCIYLRFEHTDERWEMLHRIRELETALADLPDNVEIELVTAAEVDEESPEESGTFRLSGSTRNGQWHIKAVYPQLDNNILHEMLLLSRAADENRPLPCTIDEAEAVLERCEHDPSLEDMNITFDKGLLRVKPRAYLELLGLHLFQVRYSGVLPVADEDELNLLINDQFEQAQVSIDTMFSLPVSDNTVFSGKSGWFAEPDFSRLPVTQDQVDAMNQDLIDSGFQPLGSFVSKRYSDVLVFGYGDGKQTYAVLLANSLRGEARECYTAFSDGKSLTTSTSHENENPEKGYFRQETDGGFAEVIATHREGIKRYQENGWTALDAPARLDSLAKAMDEFIVRTLD